MTSFGFHNVLVNINIKLMCFYRRSLLEHECVISNFTIVKLRNLSFPWLYNSLLGTLQEQQQIEMSSQHSLNFGHSPKTESFSAPITSTCHSVSHPVSHSLIVIQSSVTQCRAGAAPRAYIESVTFAQRGITMPNPHRDLTVSSRALRRSPNVDQ